MIKNEDTYCVVQHKIVRELGAWEAVVYGTIANLLRKMDGIGEVSNQTIMDLCGLPLASLKRYICTLIKSGYIEKKGGNGRGNISIYYITKKGLNLNTLKQKKGAQNDTEKGSKINEKGLNLIPINKGENKEKNKESGGVLRETQHTPLSNTTPQNFEEMEDFNLFWEKFPGDPEWSWRKAECENVWRYMSEEWRGKLVELAKAGKRYRERDNDDPFWYLKNYAGQDAQGELPFLRQGSQKFFKWYNDNISKGKRMCLIRFDGSVANCLYSDLDTMVKAGAGVINDNWR